MRYGAAHVDGLYTVPNGSGTQFMDGVNRIFAVGTSMRTLKVYCTSTPDGDYPLQAGFTGPVATSLAEVVQYQQYQDAFALAWDTIVLTCFTFANGQTNWWRVSPTNARLQAEYDEIYELVEYLLTTYSGSGKRFILQNWEGDWAFMDAFNPATFVPERMVPFYAAFLAVRQRAVQDARAAVAHTNVDAIHAVELNRVVDARLMNRRRILTDLAGRIKPDAVSFSAYDATIVDQGGWGANQAAWEAATEPVLTRALRNIKAAFPGTPLYVGEFGFPENEATNDHPLNNVIEMIELVERVCRTEECTHLLYWQVFDNESSVPYTYRGYWLQKPNGDPTLASQAMGSFVAS